MQNFAARQVTKRWQAPHDQLLGTLKWEHLTVRRKKQKVLLCHRILRGGSLIPPSKFTPHPSPHLRHLDDQPLFCPHACSRAHLSSFFVSAVPLWNSVNPSVMSYLVCHSHLRVVIFSFFIHNCCKLLNYTREWATGLFFAVLSPFQSSCNLLVMPRCAQAQ